MEKLYAYVIEFNSQMLEENVIANDNFDPKSCFNCGSINLEQENYGRVCLNCSAIGESFVELIHSHESLKNYSSKKYAYNRTDYFLKCVEQYQGKQTCNISDELLEKISLNIEGEVTKF